MSRIAKQPVSFPESVQISIKDDEVLHIQGQNNTIFSFLKELLENIHNFG